MAGQIAIFEGWDAMPRKRKKSRRGGGQRSKFSAAAKKCSRIARRRKGSFQACMKRELKGSRGRGRKRSGRGRKRCPPGCR